GLWYHPTGGYAKKFRGKTYYFGQDPEVAAQRFKEEWPYIQAGEAPPEYSDDLTLLKLCNSFMADRDSRVQTGDLAVRSFEDYKRSCKAMLDALGKHTLVKNLRPAEFGILRSALAR